MHAKTSLISPTELRRLTALKPHLTLLELLFDWVVIALSIGISIYANNLVVYVVAVCVIGSRMQALATIMHESVHYRLSKNKLINEWVGDVFAAWPLITTVAKYRDNHLTHHKNLNTDADPDWVAKAGTVQFTFPQKLRTAILRVLGYACGVFSIRDIYLFSTRPKSPALRPPAKSYAYIRAGAHIAFLSLLIATGWWVYFLLYWAIPYVTSFWTLVYMKSIAEHFGDMDYSNDLGSSRTVIAGPIERFFFGPHNLCYHLEHHLFPSVPFYNLPELHEILMRNKHYAANAHITHGYLTGVVKECFTVDALVPDDIIDEM